MPLFGKKDNKSSEKKAYPTQQGGGYPTQPTGGYPTQPVAPQQVYTTNAAPPGAMGGYAAPPPPYAPPGQQPPPAAAPPMGHGHPGQYPQVQPGGMYPGQPMPPGGPNTTYVVHGGFDAGARFDGNSPPSIPPPPPGCAPNAAQAAAAQGANVQITQRQGDWFTGGSDGGYTVW